MLGQSGANRIWLCTLPTDMRRSFDGLSAMARNVMQQDPTNGDWFVFINRRRTQMRILYYAPGGYSLWCKRLEKGTFATLKKGSLTFSELMLLIEGIDVKTVRKRQRFSRKKG
ncbi:IS66 family insertion sequence element accessory protein TnpB [Vibrio lentus]|uniref:Transposase n=1 Tax=Vibrio lentus TaxID=136468 RepID=A0A2N7BI69_9VIBR|nr:IS66 family insertion sequence element accessory protein TnpB [Vibrio lentus]PME54311.1 transposase [Vibrio lentus]PME55773.1 transposase [Vibrio lentus]PME93032.1 transposase [Vibrio lentus]PMG74961.1 transposase [Vibrio lentus]PMH92302.1 transposase [Vibrio lentus]